MNDEKMTNNIDENVNSQVSEESTDMPEQEQAKGVFKSKRDKKADKKAEANKAAELHSALISKEEELSKAKKALEDCEEQYMRVRAEYDNYRKRAVKEKEACYSDAFSDAVSAFLPLIDSMDRACEFATDDSNLSKGVQMMKKQLEDILQKINVSEIKSDGEQFDPEKHNAIMHDEDDSDMENVVVQTFQKGYTLKDKVIRHAMVKVLN